MIGIFPTDAEVEAELETLRAERAALDERIAERERFLALGRKFMGSDPPASPPSSEGRAADASSAELAPERSTARAEGRRLFEAVLRILAAARRPMHARDLVADLAADGFVLAGRDPVAALNTKLWKRSRTDPRLVRHGDAVYGAGVDTGEP